MYSSKRINVLVQIRWEKSSKINKRTGMFIRNSRVGVKVIIVLWWGIFGLTDLFGFQNFNRIIQMRFCQIKTNTLAQTHRTQWFQHLKFSALFQNITVYLRTHCSSLSLIQSALSWLLEWNDHLFWFSIARLTYFWTLKKVRQIQTS